jgi:hypothetical protein
LKARDVSAALAGRSGIRRSLIVMGALVAFLCAAGFSALLGTGASPAGADSACPNEAIRLRQGSTRTGDCRAWERVSPAEKGDGDIIAVGEGIVAEKEGNGAIFNSSLSFGDTAGSGVAGDNAYLARRGADGWTTHALYPTPAPGVPQVFNARDSVEVFSEDLDRALLSAYDLPSVSGDTPERQNLYQEETASRGLRTISAFQRPGEAFCEGEALAPCYEPYPLYEFFAGLPLYGASSDLNHVGVVSSAQFLPTGTAPGYPNPSGGTDAYTWDDGTLHLAGILPDGTVPPGGSTMPGGTGEGGFRGAISADGSRQVFLASPDGSVPQQLYLRIDDAWTAFVTESENPTFTEAAQNVEFEGMTPDGRHLFFQTRSPLLAEDHNTASDLYRWTAGSDPEHEENLTLISDDGRAGGDANFGGALVGMSDDGRIVYVHDIGNFLYVWIDGERTTVDPSVTRWGGGQHLSLSAVDPGFGRVSADGQWLAYLKDGSRMCIYGRVDETVNCPGNANVVPNLNETGARPKYAGFRPRFLSDDGRVFFTSGEALVPEDINGVADVYEYDGPTSRVSLLSSGTGKQPSEFADASASGDDVFFATRQQLVPSDTDEYIDLYDARAGGGFEEPQTPSSPCLGESCQGAGGVAADALAISSTAATRGNLKPQGARRCSKGRRAVKRHGKHRCVKAKRRAHHRRGSK